MFNTQSFPLISFVFWSLRPQQRLCPGPVCSALHNGSIGSSCWNCSDR